jgi:hypothetical protein
VSRRCLCAALCSPLAPARGSRRHVPTLKSAPWRHIPCAPFAKRKATLGPHRLRDAEFSRDFSFGGMRIDAIMKGWKTAARPQNARSVIHRGKRTGGGKSLNLLNSLLPNLGIARRMKDREDDNCFAPLTIKDAIRKSFDHCFANVAKYDAMHSRSIRDAAKNRFNSGAKNLAQTGTLRFVPIARLVKLCPRGLAEYDRPRHCDHRANASSRTCSQGTASSGFSSSSTSRRSSSSRCASVSGS